MLAVLKEFRTSYLNGLIWGCGSCHGSEGKRQCYLNMLAQTLKDAPVRRSDQVLEGSRHSTFGDFEAASVLYCETDVSTMSCLIALCSCLHWITCQCAED